MKNEGSSLMCIKFRSKVPAQSKDIDHLSVMFDWPRYIFSIGRKFITLIACIIITSMF